MELEFHFPEAPITITRGTELVGIVTEGAFHPKKDVALEPEDLQQIHSFIEDLRALAGD